MYRAEDPGSPAAAAAQEGVPSPGQGSPRSREALNGAQSGRTRPGAESLSASGQSALGWSVPLFTEAPSVL